MNIILNIVSKKENLSYPLIFKKIANYYWNKEKLCKYLKCDNYELLRICVKNKYTSMFKLYNSNLLLDISCEEGCFDTVKYLVEKGVDIHDGKDYAFRICSRYGHLEIVKYLLEKGADINYVPTAIQFASSYKHVHVVNFLLKYIPKS